MKKGLALILAMVMSLTLVGCGGETTSQTKTEDTSIVETADVADQADESETETAAISTEEEEAEPEEAAFEEQVLVDNDQCKVTVTAAGYDGLWGYVVTVALENKTEDETLMFSIEDASINDYMCDPFWASEVTAGKKANEDITWYQDTLDENGIEDVETIEFTLTVYDSDDWEKDAYVSESFTITP